MPNPYQNIENYRKWRTAVADVEAHLFDPVTASRFRMTSESRIATAGSCFAQHIAQALMKAGCNYLVTEPGTQFEPVERTARNYGVFTARYGNIYTTAQLRQLYDEAYGRRTPADAAWQRADGAWVDPFRQMVEPAGFADAGRVAEDRAAHLSAVRQMFETCDLFVFTLGLTECWLSRHDGSVFSSAPGVIAGQYDPAAHIFANLDVQACFEDLSAFLHQFHAANPAAKVLLTVSPVPLIATAEDRSVVVATTYSKSVLRVVADMAWQAFDWVDYFPSYEIITGSQAHGRYFEIDARQINRIGVAHAMRSFMNNYMELPAGGHTVAPLARREEAVFPIMCDEESLDAREAM